MSEKRKRGRPVTHPAVMCNETGKVYKTYTEAGKDIGRNRVNVMRCVTGMQRHSGGYTFRFVEEE